MEVIDNKTGVPMAHYLQLYKELDPLETAKRCNIVFNEEEGGFELTLLSTRLLVHFPEFSLEIKSDCKYKTIFDSPYVKILIIEFLCERTSAPFGGKFLTYREMPWGEVYDSNFNGRCRMRLAFSFGNNIEGFKSGCEVMGGQKLTKDGQTFLVGDASYELQVFEDMYMHVIIYAGDDEFPPSSQFLFSDNMAVAFTAEDRCVFGDLIINGLKALSVI